MPRTVYLIRHAMPDIPIGERWCIGGRTDLPLGDLGRLQAALLPFQPELKNLSAVFCSTLRRARETALPLCPEPREMPGLEEQDMGVWDGLPFTEIRARRALCSPGTGPLPAARGGRVRRGAAGAHGAGRAALSQSERGRHRRGQPQIRHRRPDGAA